MAGGDNYKEFDTSSIITTTTGKDTISIGKMSFRKRDIILGGIAVLALVMVIVLAIVLAVEVSKVSQNCPEIASSAGQTGGKEACITPACLRAAAYEKTIMNENMDPCSDFYTFACGAYADNNPQTELLNDVTPFQKILLENTQRLIYLLDYSVDRGGVDSYERKLKHFMSSCTNHFDKMTLAGQPLIEKVLKPFGGWYVFGQFDPAKFNFDDSLKKVHIDFWTTAFFRMIVNVDGTNWNKRIVELDPGGLGLDYFYYADASAATTIHFIYTEYIKHVSTLLVYDAGLQPNDTVITQFSDDVYEVENNVSRVIFKSPIQLEPHEPANRVTLSELNTIVKNQIDFVDYFKSVFYKNKDQYTGSTTVAILRQDYFTHLGDMIEEYMKTDEGKRKLHNYLAWQLINRYSHDLSWNYVHAKRQLNNYLFGNKDTSSGYAYCFQVAEGAMSDAMNALYVKEHIDTRDRDEANNMLDMIKEQMLNGIKSLPWMTGEDRTEAAKKVSESLYKIGYPDYLVNEQYLDNLYKSANISESDFFGNMLTLNNVHKENFNELMGQQDSKTLWAYHIFQPVVEYYNPWHELIATSAVLQSPLFTYDSPAYYNYGGVGTILARHLVHAVDEYGSRYKLDNSGRGTWWANMTTQHYNDIKQCAIDAQSKETLGPFTDSAGNVYNPSMSTFSGLYAPEMLADSSGLRIAYKAYKARESRKGAEAIPAGFPNYSSDQMFFIAYAQAYCQNTPDQLKEIQLLQYVRYPSKNKVNLAVSQVPEFQRAFSCQAGKPLAPEKTCTLFENI